MSINRYAARRDENEQAVVDALEAAGASVTRLGQPMDLLVGYQGRNTLLEVKKPLGPRGGMSSANAQGHGGDALADRLASLPAEFTSADLSPDHRAGAGMIRALIAAGFIDRVRDRGHGEGAVWRRKESA